MKILVTGAAGFVGSHLFRKLKEKGLDVHGIDNFSSYYSVEYKTLRLRDLEIDKGAEVEQCDISDFKQIGKTISMLKPTYIINLAAQAGVRLGLSDSDSYISTNINGFQNIIRSAIENDVRGILYASSSSVYGESTPTPFVENAVSLRPKSIYGVSKLSNELLAEIQAKSGKLRFRGLRYFTVYGPWGRPDMAYFRIVAAALGEGKFTLFGDGSIKRDFTFIDDVVDNTIALFDDLTRREEGFNDIVNIGGSRPFEISHLIDLIADQSNHKLEIMKATESKLDSRITMADNSYLKSIVGELKFTDLEKGVEHLIDWAKRDNIKPNLLNWIQSTV